MNQRLDKLEALTLDYLKKRPFHNLFITYELDIKGSKIGGTCSDLTLEFKEILEQNGFGSTLHCSLVDGAEIHKLLKVEINKKFYFIDVGFG
jgi:arylamine N-acetyltransferase